MVLVLYHVPKIKTTKLWPILLIISYHNNDMPLLDNRLTHLSLSSFMQMEFITQQYCGAQKNMTKCVANVCTTVVEGVVLPEEHIMFSYQIILK